MNSSDYQALKILFLIHVVAISNVYPFLHVNEIVSRNDFFNKWSLGWTRIPKLDKVDLYRRRERSYFMATLSG